MAQATPGNINRLERQVSALQALNESISVDLRKVGAYQEQIKSDVIDLHTTIHQYFEEDKRLQNVGLAETRLGNVRQEIDTEFGHYASIRRRTTGVLQAIDAGLVTDDVIQHTVEDLMMDAPRYWLAPAVVSVAAWCRREEEVTERGSREAMARDAAKSALFFALVMRRENNEAAIGWLNNYLDRLKADELGREFVVILDAVTMGAFGPVAVDGIKSKIDRWLQYFEQQPGIDDQQADLWRTQLRGLHGSDQFTYPTLSEVSPVSDDLKQSLADVRSHERIASDFTELFARELPKDLLHEEKIDDILTSLVQNFDEEELPLRRKEIEYQAIIDTDGDLVAAKAEAARVGTALDETQPFPNLLAATSFHPAEVGATVATQRLAITLSKRWLLQGYDSLTAEIRNAEVEPVPVEIEGWLSTITKQSEEQTLVSEMEVHFDQQTEAEVAARSHDVVGIGAGIFGALIAFWGLVNLNFGVVLLGLAGVAYAAYTYQRTIKDRDRIKVNGDQRKKQAAATLRDALSELVDYRNEWSTEDAKASSTRARLNDLRPSGEGLTGRKQVS